jgi:hypothetical protein
MPRHERVRHPARGLAGGDDGEAIACGGIEVERAGKKVTGVARLEGGADKGVEIGAAAQ